MGTGPPPGRALRALSPREREVVDLVATGLTHRAIGARLGIAPTTVRGHVATACLKVGLQGGGRALVAWLTAAVNGILALLLPLAACSG